MNDLLKLADHSAAQSDRWLFIATLIVLGAFAWYVARNFMRQYQALIDDQRKSGTNYQNGLRKLVNEHSTTNQKLITCLNKNTQVLEQCRDALRK
jgi:predicted PurR-regulated permease PerM